MHNKEKIIRLFVGLVVSASVLSACTAKEPSITEPTEIELEIPEITEIVLLEDPSYETRFTEDPYAQLSIHTIEAQQPDQTLYNYLFNAALNGENAVDISAFDLTPDLIMRTASSLYEQAGFQLYHMSFVNWSKDYKTITFVYNDQGAQVTENQYKFYSHMNHLLHNVAPTAYNEYQKFFSLYDYIGKNTRYTDDMDNVRTHTAFSLLTSGKGICGGFSQLADYVLNDVGIPSKYISNEPHAWNQVTLEGVKYHTDFTWGAGYTNESYLSTALMSDQARLEGLDNSGYGGFQIIEGFPRFDPQVPQPSTDTRYDFLKQIGSGYALDIQNSWIYYSDYVSIQRVNFDGSGQTTVWDQSCFYLAAFDGILYFTGENSNGLYKMIPGEAPERIDELADISEMSIKDGVLVYSSALSGEQKTLNLAAYDLSAFDAENSKTVEIVTLAAHKTFAVQITFTQEMDTDKFPKEAIGLINADDEIVPLNMFWSEDGKTLTLRSQSYIHDVDALTLYVNEGIVASSGAKTTENYQLLIKREGL